MDRRGLFIWATVGMVAAFGAARLECDGPTTTLGGVGIDFNSQIRPILANNCFRCHGPDDGARKAGLRLDTQNGARAALRRGGTVIVPGYAEASELIDKVTASDEEDRMPPADAGPRLTSTQIELLKQWINQGAEYDTHWSYVPLQRPDVPGLPDGGWVRSDIDRFVLARLNSDGLSPSTEADPYTLLRRVSLDLTGLPPTPQEIGVFVNDESPDPYARVVERLLASSGYGEHWAGAWLDLARYADTNGYEKDGPRTIWRYRDWVIDAFNTDMPFDQFTIEQLAGDLLPEPTQSQILATAFHRNTMNNTEGGTDNEEFRIAAVKDRIETTFQVWMGTTLACAQCHSHKYDPITQHDYYRFLAVFNQTEDADTDNLAPTVAMPSSEQGERLAQIEQRIKATEAVLKTESDELVAERDAWIEEASANPIRWLTLEPSELAARSNATFSLQPDGSILIAGDSPPTDEYTLTADLPLAELTGLRLEALPDASLPSNGPGRVGHGNFVISEVRAFVEAELAVDRVGGRFIRISLPGLSRILSLAEVQVFAGVNNLAPLGTATQSTTDYGGTPERAVDGNIDGKYSRSLSVTHTTAQEDPWWELDLGEEAAIDAIVMWNRTDGQLHHRLDGALVSVLDEERKVMWQGSLSEASSRRDLFNFGPAGVVLFESATATYSQTDWHIDEAIDGQVSVDGGWAVGPHYGKPHTAILQTGGGHSVEPGSRITIALVQNHGTQHTLGRFRLSVTSAPPSQHQLPATVSTVLAKNRSDWTEGELDEVTQYHRSISTVLAPTRSKLVALQKEQRAEATMVPQIPVMRELPENRRRTTHVHVRGSFLNPGDQVGPGVPKVFDSIPAGNSVDRLSVARWLTDRANPLTARVLVNRYWEHFFGIGLVETSEEFGTQGMPPSHPELLDWLAAECVDRDWSMKELCRLIVTSATYRQSTTAAAGMRTRDPFNRLLARGPRFRLSAETIRDQALAVSGLLNRQMYGSSVMPRQPDGMLPQAFSDYVPASSSGADTYRRGLYTFWRRTGHYPSFAMFDAPSREVCTIRRIRTNTPLAALVTLNDPVYIEIAQALARRMLLAATESESRIRHGVLLALARPAGDAEVERLIQLYDDRLKHYQQHPAAAEQMASEPLGPLPDGLDVAEAAAMTLIANVLLNLDEFLTKG